VIVVAAFILNPMAKKRRLREAHQAFSISDPHDEVSILHGPSRLVTPQPPQSQSNSIASLTSTVVEEMEEGRLYSHKDNEKGSSEGFAINCTDQTKEKEP